MTTKHPSSGVQALRPLRKEAVERTERILRLVKSRSRDKMPAIKMPEPDE